MDTGKRRRISKKRKGKKIYPTTMLYQQVYAHYETQPVCKTQKVLSLDQFQLHPGYETYVSIGNSGIEISNAFSQDENLSKKIALEKASKHLEKVNWKIEVAKPIITKRLADNMDVLEWAKLLNNENIAVLFKDILSHFEDKKKIQNVRYLTRVCREGDLVGYTSELKCNDEMFRSVGLMTNEDQAEQSAAEVCLRTLGYLPEVDSEKDLSIQPYQGGFVAKDVTSRKPYLFTSKLSSDILEAFVASKILMSLPKYYVKYAKSQPNETGAEKLMDCICCVDGKVFQASTFQPESIAIQLAADKAVDYFCISNPHERMHFRKHSRLYRYDFYRRGKLQSDKQPSQKGWQWRCFARENYYEECEISKTVKDVFESYLFLNNLRIVDYQKGMKGANLRSMDYQKEMIEAEIRRKPSFKGALLSNLDVCVTNIDATNPNLVTIGNSEFSIKMWCSDGKIYSKQRKCLVHILPGHNIQQLSCEYRAFLPSLEVYLHAVNCRDLLYPNPPKPVVKSCGVVVLFHDYSASPTDIYVLLQQKIDYEERKTSPIISLKTLLQKLIQPSLKVEVSVTQVMEGIMEQWNEDNVKLLSEMSMDSLYHVMSKYGKYDSRWNELFARVELPKELQEIQDLCLNELKRREEEKAVVSNEGDVDTSQQWELPESELMSRFDDTGIDIEGSTFCGMRSLAEKTGMKISLADIEKCSTIDIHTENDRKQHRGELSRYYIWNKVEKNPVPKVEDVENELPEGYKFLKKQSIRHNCTRYTYMHDIPGKKRRFLSKRINGYFQHVQYVNRDGTKVSPTETQMNDAPKNTTVGKDIAEEEVSEKTDVPSELDTEPSGGTTNETENGEESMECDREHAESLQAEIDPYSITEDVIEKKNLSDDGNKEYEIVDKADEAVEEDGGNLQEEYNQVDDSIPLEDMTEKKNSSDEGDEESEIDEEDEAFGEDKGDDKNAEEDLRDEYSHVDDDDVGVARKDTNVERRSNGKRRVRKRPRKLFKSYTLSKTVSRDVFLFQCEWMLWDKATNVCPMLKKIAETTQFQDQLTRFASEMDR